MNVTIKELLSVPHVVSRNFKALTAKKFSGVSTDSRTIKPGELFLAIRGEHFDGHKFVTRAFSQGAICAVIDQDADISMLADHPLFVVKDTVEALGKLANIHRKKFGIPIIAVAGSNGKTTTREMIASVLGTQYSVLSTKGNLNNHIGVPQTLFRLMRRHEIAVIEIGTNHFGELKYLCEILNPTHGLITNIGREHLEFFQNINGVAKAEGELFKSMGKTGSGFVNADEKLIVQQAKQLKRKITYGFSKRRNQIQGRLIEVNNNGCPEFSVRAERKKEFGVKLSVPGTYAMMNGLAAAAVGVTFGIKPNNIKRALEGFTCIGKRMESITVGSITILNDTYNANPDSVISALGTIRSMKCKGNKIIVLADMLELGDAAQKEHELIGKVVGDMGFEYGELAKYINISATVKTKIHYEQKNILSEYTAELLSDGDIVLVKGSRGMKMEDVVTFLIERLEKK
jgi:UDP-N-acetylmuramoyl-tripeptide--D-alanyl-D-alanine ligase